MGTRLPDHPPKHPLPAPTLLTPHQISAKTNTKTPLPQDQRVPTHPLHGLTLPQTKQTPIKPHTPGTKPSLTLPNNRKARVTPPPDRQIGGLRLSANVWSRYPTTRCRLRTVPSIGLPATKPDMEALPNKSPRLFFDHPCPSWHLRIPVPVPLQYLGASTGQQSVVAELIVFRRCSRGTMPVSR